MASSDTLSTLESHWPDTKWKLQRSLRTLNPDGAPNGAVPPSLNVTVGQLGNPLQYVWIPQRHLALWSPKACHWLPPPTRILLPLSLPQEPELQCMIPQLTKTMLEVVIWRPTALPLVLLSVGNMSNPLCILPNSDAELSFKLRVRCLNVRGINLFCSLSP